MTTTNLSFHKMISDSYKMLISPSISSACDSFLKFIPYPTSLNEKKNNIKTSGTVSAKQTRLNIRRRILGFHSRFPADCLVCTGSRHVMFAPYPKYQHLHENNAATISHAFPVLRTTPRTLYYILRYFKFYFLRKLTQK